MKKTLLNCLTATLLTWTVGISYSQQANANSNVGYSDEELVSSAGRKTFTGSSASKAPAEIKKAVKSFSRDYGYVANAKWLTLDHGFSVVYFTVDGVKTRLLYDKKGRCESIIRYYFEDKLPASVRHIVKTMFYDFNIFHVIEPTINGVTSYLVKMEDKSSWKTVKVIDGEVEVVEEYSKLK